MTIASHPRSGSASAASSAAAYGRRAHGRVRLCPLSKNSATIVPPGHQRAGLISLPRPRRHGILPVFGRYAPVERELFPEAAFPAGTVAASENRSRLYLESNGIFEMVRNLVSNTDDVRHP